MNNVILNLRIDNERKSTAYWATADHRMVDVYLDGVKISEYNWNPSAHGDATLYEVESCLVSDALSVADGKSFEEFCKEYDYDLWGEGRERSYTIYNHCLDTYWTLVRTGSWERLKKIHEND